MGYNSVIFHYRAGRWSLQSTALHVLHILSDGIEASLLLLLPFIAQDIGLSLTQVGLLGALINVVALQGEYRLLPIISSAYGNKPSKTPRFTVVFWQA